eukprot:gene13360-9189_t
MGSNNIAFLRKPAAALNSRAKARMPRDGPAGDDTPTFPLPVLPLLLLQTNPGKPDWVSCPGTYGRMVFNNFPSFSLFVRWCPPGKVEGWDVAEVQGVSRTSALPPSLAPSLSSFRPALWGCEAFL